MEHGLPEVVRVPRERPQPGLEDRRALAPPPPFLPRRDEGVELGVGRAGQEQAREGRGDGEGVEERVPGGGLRRRRRRRRRRSAGGKAPPGRRGRRFSRGRAAAQRKARQREADEQKVLHEVDGHQLPPPPVPAPGPAHLGVRRRDHSSRRSVAAAARGLSVEKEEERRERPLPLPLPPLLLRPGQALAYRASSRGGTRVQYGSISQVDSCKREASHPSRREKARSRLASANGESDEAEIVVASLTPEEEKKKKPLGVLICPPPRR